MEHFPEKENVKFRKLSRLIFRMAVEKRLYSPWFVNCFVRTFFKREKNKPKVRVVKSNKNPPVS